MSKTLGKTFNDRKRSAKVRDLALDLLEKVLEPSYKDKNYQKEVLLRMAPNLIPRLNEHSGVNGEPIVIELSGVAAQKYAINRFAE